MAAAHEYLNALNKFLRECEHVLFALLHKKLMNRLKASWDEEEIASLLLKIFYQRQKNKWWSPNLQQRHARMQADPVFRRLNELNDDDDASLSDVTKALTDILAAEGQKHVRGGAAGRQAPPQRGQHADVIPPQQQRQDRRSSGSQRQQQQQNA